MRLLITILTTWVSLAGYAHAQNEPNQNAPTCASSPAELQTKSETLARMATFGGIEAVLGTWQISSIFAKNKISFDFDNQHFFVQTDNDVRKQVSICVSESEAEWLRISVHAPGCPENKNIYVRPDGKDRMKLRAYATRALGSVTLKKISPRPVAPGSPKPPVKCADGSMSGGGQR